MLVRGLSCRQIYTHTHTHSAQGTREQDIGSEKSIRWRPVSVIKMDLVFFGLFYRQFRVDIVLLVMVEGGSTIVSKCVDEWMGGEVARVTCSFIISIRMKLVKNRRRFTPRAWLERENDKKLLYLQNVYAPISFMLSFCLFRAKSLSLCYYPTNTTLTLIVGYHTYRTHASEGWKFHLLNEPSRTRAETIT